MDLRSTRRIKNSSFDSITDSTSFRVSQTNYTQNKFMTSTKTYWELFTPKSKRIDLGNTLFNPEQNIDLHIEIMKLQNNIIAIIKEYNPNIEIIKAIERQFSMFTNCIQIEPRAKAQINKQFNIEPLLIKLDILLSKVYESVLEVSREEDELVKSEMRKQLDEIRSLLNQAKSEGKKVRGIRITKRYKVNKNMATLNQTNKINLKKATTRNEVEELKQKIKSLEEELCKYKQNEYNALVKLKIENDKLKNDVYKLSMVNEIKSKRELELEQKLSDLKK